MDTNKLTRDLKKLATSQVFVPLSKKLNAYEKKARGMAKEFDLLSREARGQSKARLDEFLLHLKKTRTEVESKVRALFDEESRRLNARVNDFLESIRSVAQAEVVAKPAPAKTVAATRRKKASPRKTTKKSTTRASSTGASATT